MDSGTQKAIDRTQVGIVLLAFGALLEWIPVISIAGSVLILIGAICVILGRSAFGAAHSRNVGIAVTLYIIGLIGSLVLASYLLGALEGTAQLGSAGAPAAVVGLFNGFLIGGIIVGLLAGLGTVLFLWSLLDTKGKVLIWASFFASFAILFVVWLVIIGQVGSAVSAAFAANPPDPGPLVALDDQVRALDPLKAIPDLLMVGAAYTAWSRIERGVIPKRPRPGPHPAWAAASRPDLSQRSPPRE